MTTINNSSKTTTTPVNNTPSAAEANVYPGQYTDNNQRDRRAATADQYEGAKIHLVIFLLAPARWRFVTQASSRLWIKPTMRLVHNQY